MACSKQQLILLNQKRYHLNKSCAKYVSIGLSYEDGFQPCITLNSCKAPPVVFCEYDWREFLTHRDQMENYFYCSTYFDPICTPGFKISFEQFNDVKCVRVEDKRGYYIWLAMDSLNQLIKLLPLLDYRIDMLKRQDFLKYYQSQLAVARSERGGDIAKTILMKLSPSTNPNLENVSTMMEILLQYPYLPDFESKYYDNYPTNY